MQRVEAGESPETVIRTSGFTRSCIYEWLARYPALRERAKPEGTTICFGGESGVRSDYHAGTTWGERGKTPVVKSIGARASVNMLSAINAKGEMRFMMTTGKLNAGVFVEFLKRLLHNAKRPVFLILDGRPVHRPRVGEEFVRSTGGKLSLFFLPGYSPELNPQETISSTMALGPAREAKSRLFRPQRRPAIIRPFFEPPDVRYAAVA
ncbi:MAG: transposase [Bryobacterales bacterium]|nr:transposase [Bryobacterales bacterium]